MALKEQANKKKTPRNRSDGFRDGKPLERAIEKNEERIINDEGLVDERG